MIDGINSANTSKSEIKIIKAAFDLFANKGYAATSVEKIAFKAKVSKGLIYHYFDSKEAILKAVFSSLVERSGIINSASIANEPQQYLKNLIEQSFEFITGQTKLLRLLLSLSAQPEVVKGLKKELESIRSLLMERMVGVFKKLRYAQPELEAYQLIAIFDGAGLGYITLKSYPIKELRAFVEKKYNL
ncbi:TetR/AcrR family transcriptional regulator [Parapedobacter sp.]